MITSSPSTLRLTAYTDRGVGQRVIMQGGMQVGSQTVGHYDLTALDFSGQPQGGAMRLSHTSNFNPLGGTYIAEARNYVSPLDDTEWGGIPTSGMALWLKADSLDLANGAAVTSWKDVSGNGHEFTQGTVSSQPDFVATDSDYNNKPHVHFDGDDALATTFSSGLNPNNFTAFIVSTVDADDGNYHGIVENRDGNTGWILYARMSGSTNYWQWRTGTGSAVTTMSAGSNTVVPNTPSIVTLRMSGSDGAGGGTTTQNLFVNGVSEVTSSAVFTKKTATTAMPILGDVGSFELTGQMAEVIIYSSALSDQQRLQVEGYLAEKYGITAASAWKSSNPYHTDTNGHQRTNVTDKRISYMLRPVRLLDKQHAEMFRSNLALHSSSPQYGSNYFGATAGGKYGLYVYETTNGKASVGSYIRATNPDTNPPYAPAYYMDISASDTVPMSQGPKIIGTGESNFDSSLLDNEVTRIVMSENTLQHYRADAARRRTHQEGEQGRAYGFQRQSSLLPISSSKRT